MPIDSVKSESIQQTTQNYSETSKDSQKNLIDLRNGYFARTYKAADTIDLITSAFLGEVILKRTDNGYTKRTTDLYVGEEDWNSKFDQSCKLADANHDYILEEDETQELLDLSYDALHKHDNDVIWVEEDEK